MSAGNAGNCIACHALPGQTGLASILSPRIHILAGEKVCIQVIIPIQALLALASTLPEPKPFCKEEAGRMVMSVTSVNRSPAPATSTETLAADTPLATNLNTTRPSPFAFIFMD